MHPPQPPAAPLADPPISPPASPLDGPSVCPPASPLDGPPASPLADPSVGPHVPNGHPARAPEELGPFGGPVDGRRFRTVLGQFATGVVAITALGPGTGRPCGLAANAFTSVSLDPPLVAFCVAHTSTSWPLVREAGAITVNVLADHQRQACAQLATSGGDKFAGLAWTRSPGGNPVLDGALAWIDCAIEAEHTAGDHMIVVARVLQLDTHAEGGPLVFFRGSYGRFDG